MTESTPNLTTLLSPEETIALLSEYLPGFRQLTREALRARVRRGSAPASLTYSPDGVGGPARWGWDRGAVIAWCLKRQPPRVRRALALLSECELLDGQIPPALPPSVEEILEWDGRMEEKP